MLQEKGVIGD
jgi:hypothetical protein